MPGPKGAPGMPEAGYLPIPKKLARGGVKDMVRISDARMSGTAFGTIVLHITPESAVGGPLALVKNGDMIRLDVAKRSIDLLVDAAELEKRRAALAACRRRRIGPNAATRICSTRPSCRPTKAAISISCAARGRGRQPRGERARRPRVSNHDAWRILEARAKAAPSCVGSLPQWLSAIISQLRYALCLIDIQTTPMG